MAANDSLEALQGLHRDLLALSENRLKAIERLLGELESRIDEFRNLLDKKSKSDLSRQKLSKGTIELDGVEYSINDDFRQETIEIADELDLDEVESAKLFLLAQEDAQELDRSPVVAATIRFHRQRQLLLECFRLALKFSIAEPVESEGIEDIKHALNTFVDLVVDLKADNPSTGSKFWQRCFSSMHDIEVWLQRLADRTQRASVIGHSFSEDASQILDFERITLIRQHESLASICTMLVHGSHTFDQDLTHIFTKAKTFDRQDIILVHHLPILMAAIARAGSSSFGATDVAKDLAKIVLAEKETDQWTLRNFHAAILICWYAEGAGKDAEHEHHHHSKRETEEADRRFERFMKALQDGAFHLLLSVAQDVKRSEWPDPAKTAVIDFLLEDAVRLPADALLPESDFQDLLMDQYQAFADAFITNLPDTLRRLRMEEDEQRRLLRSRFQRAPNEYQSHLERFLVLISFAYDDDEEAADGFWSDPDGNLYGFLQWLAKRQTTPRVAAFCEMLRSICQNSVCANAAYRFLLEEGVPVPGKLRRTGSISWNQIFAELEFYASSINQSGSYAGNQVAADQLIEPESALMLECYLRLVSHLCTNSVEARTFLLNSDNPRFDVILFQLAGSNIESRLRACAFTTLASLLEGKSLEVGEGMWALMDLWISGGASSSTAITRAIPAHPTSAWSEHTIFEIIAVGYEEPNAYLRLLNALVSPYQNEAGLNDALPFPESLGSTYRMPGISSYVDFAVGRIFGEKSLNLTNITDQRIMRLNCLDFIATCISTFNDDLVVIANRSSFPVEGAMRSSSLEAYTRLHPFARTMEWMYNEKVLKALFATAHQDINDVNAAASDSPLILSLIRAIDVMNLILKLQATYFDIVRPLIKQSTTRKEPVAHAAIASFEEAVMTNLNIIVDLGLYCGTGHQDLITTSLSLLEKLAASRKLIVPTAGFNKRADRSKLVGVLEQDNEADRIARSLIAVLRQDERELEGGPESAGYNIKVQILNFLLRCLEALPDRPTIAHLLMGFICGATDIEVSPNGLFAQGSSLFHAAVSLSLDYPNSDGETFSSWLSVVRVATINVLQLLWKSSLSSGLVMTELRTQEYVFLQALRQPILSPDMLWDGKTTSDPEFLTSDSALALRNVLSQRIAFLDLLTRELSVANREGFSSLRSRLSSTLLGSATFPGVDPIPCPTVFDFFDFMEMEVGEGIPDPKFNLLKDLDFSICREGVGALFNLNSAKELILLRRNELQKSGRALSGSPEWVDFDNETEVAIAMLRATNQNQIIEATFADTLKAWTQLITVALESGDFDRDIKSSFSIQTLQLILPKLEQSFSGKYDTAIDLAQLVSSLLKYSGSEESDDIASGGAHTGLFHVFRISLNGIVCNVATPELREICYLNCFRYMQNAAGDASTRELSSNGKVLRALKLAGSRLMDTICDDAYSDQTNSCRVAALLLLDALVSAAATEKSEYILEIFGRSNFVGVLVDSIKIIPQELSQVSTGDLPSLLSYYTALLALLLRIARTRLGGSQILRAGLFQAVRHSQLFSADPDVGFELESSEALRRFFDLMLSVLRIINAVVLARGQQHETTIHLARQFLSENRNTVVAVFKRAAGIGGVRVEADIDLSDLVDGFTLLISATDFLEYEDEKSPRKARLNAFA